jgi:hypothetical protein
MRETHSLVRVAAVKPTLDVIRKQFEIWRKRRRCRSPIPEALWQAAVGLCQERSIGEVSRTLRLNYNDLKNRVPKGIQDLSLAVGQRPSLDFVRLDLEGPMRSSECLVEMETPNGAKMRMSFRGAPRDFDPVELSRAFWRQGS